MALEHAYTQKLLGMEVLETGFEAIFLRAITGSFKGRYKERKINYYVEMATTYVLIRALAFYTVESYEVMLEQKAKAERQKKIEEIDAKAKEQKKRLTEEHEASIKQKMSDFDTKMAKIQEQMAKMQDMMKEAQKEMKEAQKERDAVLKQCERDYKELLADADMTRDAQVKELGISGEQEEDANVEWTEEVPVDNDFASLADVGDRDDGTEVNPHCIEDDDTPAESQLDINSNMYAAKCARIDSGEVKGAPVEDAVPQVATKKAAQELRIKEHMARVRADNEAATMQQKEEEAAKAKKKATARKRKRQSGSSSGSPEKQEAPQGKRRSARIPKPTERFVSAPGKTGYVNDAVLGMGKQKKGKQVPSPNAVVEVPRDDFERVH